MTAAEFRGPGVHHYDDSPDDYDMDMDHQARPLGGRSGRIILLGDGTEVLTDTAEGDMFDADEDDKDLENQVSKSQPAVVAHGEREDTPGPGSSETPAPQAEQVQSPTHITEDAAKPDFYDPPSDAKIHAVAATFLPAEST